MVTSTFIGVFGIDFSILRPNLCLNRFVLFTVGGKSYESVFSLELCKWKLIQQTLEFACYDWSMRDGTTDSSNSHGCWVWCDERRVPETRVSIHLVNLTELSCVTSFTML